MQIDIHNKHIDALNHITRVLIDSRKGYERAYEMVDDTYRLKPQFLHRAQQRSELIDRFQAHIRALGGNPEMDGGMLGYAHRGWMNFSSLFQDDEKAALKAIDEGERYLANQAAERLDRDDIHGDTRELLTQAYRSAHEGEAFADTFAD